MIEKRKSQGLCIDCGGPLDRDGVRCVKCRKIKSQKEKERRDWYSSHGICPRCCKNDIMGDETICPECTASESNNTLKNRNREKYNLYQKKWQKANYQLRKEKGICTRCGKRKAMDGYFTCRICRAKGREDKKIRYGKPDRSERYKNGLCYFCDNPVKPGYKVCEKHYQMNVEKSRSSNAAKARKELISNRILY